MLKGSNHVIAATPAPGSLATPKTDFEVLEGLSVIRAKNGDSIPLVSVFQVCVCGIWYQTEDPSTVYRRAVCYVQNYGPDHVCLLPFMTHFADLSSWEYAKKLKPLIPQIEAAGVQVSQLCPKSTIFLI